MGQYLALGLAYRMNTSVDDMRKKNVSKEELREEIEQTLLFDLKLYDETETENSFELTLKEQVLDTDLIPFLEKLYPFFYHKQDNREYQELLMKLRSNPSAEEIINLAQKKSYTDFRFDKYAEPRYIRFSKPFLPCIRLNFDCIMLHLGYGKIVTEGISDFTDFFKSCIHETFKEYPIVKAMLVYITG